MMSMASSPVGKRKRAGPIETVLGELYVDTTPRKKRARFDANAYANEHGEDDPDHDPDHDTESYAGSYTAYANSINTTHTINETETPVTDASSTRSKTKPREKKYACTWPDCVKKYARPVQLQAHINSHTGARPYKCIEDDCDKEFSKREHLTRHLKDKHGSNTFTCLHLIFNSNRGIQEECGRSFPSQTKLKRHLAAHEDKEDTTCSWDGCGKVFRKQDTLQRHIKADHLGEDAYLCTIKTVDGHRCGKSFSTPSQLRSHERKEHEEPKYICDICVNTGAPPPVEFIVNDLDDEFLPGPEDTLALDEEPDHGMMDTLSLEEKSATAPGPGRFITLHELQRHNKLFHPPTCHECRKVCRSQKELVAHMDIVHSDAPKPSPAKRFVCPYDGCDRSTIENGFAKKGNMQQHVKSTHAKHQKFVCGEFDTTGIDKLNGWTRIGCGRVMNTKGSLIGHIRTQHMGLPALVGKRTGLLDKDRKYHISKRPSAAGGVISGEEHNNHDVDMGGDPASARMLSFITGYGYDQVRPFACLEKSKGCQGRFTKVYELAYHMEMTHDWNVDDINDAIEDPDTFAPDCGHGKEDDLALRQMLETELGRSQSSQQNMAEPFLQAMQN
ncbi:Transcription factor [Sphaerulina musiva]